MKSLLALLAFCWIAFGQQPPQIPPYQVGGYTIERQNAAGGTVLNNLAKIDASNHAVSATISDTAVPVFPVFFGAGTSGTAILGAGGTFACQFDGAGVTAQHYVGASASTAHRCSDLGATPPTTGWVIGTAQTAAGANAVAQVLLSSGYNSGGGGTGVVDIRSYGAVCNGTDQNTAIQAALTAGVTRLFIPAGCTWIAPSGIIPGGVNGIYYYGGNSQTSIIKSNATPASLAIQAGPLVHLYSLNLQGNGCTHLPNCSIEEFHNLRDVNALILTSGYEAHQFVVGRGSGDLAGSNWQGWGPGDTIFVDTWSSGAAVRSYQEPGSTGPSIMCGNNGGSGPCFQFFNPGSIADAAAWVGYSDANGSVETSRITSDGIIPISGFVGLRNHTITLSNGANENVAITTAGFARITGPTGAFSIGGIVNAALPSAGIVDGRQLTLYNNTTQIMTIVNQDAGSSAANRIFIPGGAPYVCPTSFCIVTLIYDGASGQWVFQSSGGGSSSVTPYTLCASGCDATVPASGTTIASGTHKQGPMAEYKCYDGASPHNLTSVGSATSAASPLVAGDLTLTYSVAPTFCEIYTPGSAGSGGGGGGGGSVFTGSTATNPAFSATPTFSLADVSVKSPVRIEPGAMTANITAVTFTNTTAGAKFSIVWLQDGTGGRTVTYGGSTANTCNPVTTANASTTQQFEVAADGTTVNGVGCNSNTGTLPSVQSCGTTSTCSAAVVYKPQIVIGSAPLVSGTPSTFTITGISPAFTSTSTYFCSVTPEAVAAGVFITKVSGSSFTVTGPNSVTTVVEYSCIGS